jgi:isocitrate/isopropylmalate dehydrogenase
MMVDFLGEHEAGARINRAVLDVQSEMAARGSHMTTTAIGDAVAERLQRCR